MTESGVITSVERTGPCQGYLCTCRVFVLAQSQPDKTWRTCECRHVQQTHSHTDGQQPRRTQVVDDD